MPRPHGPRGTHKHKQTYIRRTHHRHLRSRRGAHLGPPHAPRERMSGRISLLHTHTLHPRHGRTLRPNMGCSRRVCAPPKLLHTAHRAQRARVSRHTHAALPSKRTCTAATLDPHAHVRSGAQSEPSNAAPPPVSHSSSRLTPRDIGLLHSRQPGAMSRARRERCGATTTVVPRAARRQPPRVRMCEHDTSAPRHATRGARRCLSRALT